MKKRLKKYKPPVNANNVPYYVPVVVKNRDYLIGFLDGIFTTIAFIGSDISNEVIFSQLGSDRFNDILPDGRRISKIHKKEFEKYIINLMMEKKEVKNNTEFGYDLFDEYCLTLSCGCGNFYGFTEMNEIPSKNFNCSLCDKVLIHYTNHDDSVYEYDGDPGDLESIVKQFKSVDTEEDEDD